MGAGALGCPDVQARREDPDPQYREGEAPKSPQLREDHFARAGQPRMGRSHSHVLWLPSLLGDEAITGAVMASPRVCVLLAVTASHQQAYVKHRCARLASCAWCRRGPP